MKSVIKSLRPDVCMRIANGEQSIIVAKSAPKEVPFKVYMYQTRHKCGCRIINEVLDGVYNSGKVIGEVICDKVDKYESDIIMCAKWETNGGEVKENLRYNAGACLSAEEMFDYSNGKPLYGWHITDRKIYDEPKELREFFVPCKKYNDSELHCLEWGTVSIIAFSLAQTETRKKSVCAKEESRFATRRNRGAMWRKGKMTDKEFITYIGKILLYSGEDCCSKCLYCRSDELCDNQRACERPGDPPNDDICIEGMRRYAEKDERENH